jgi:hypothetical protein
VANWHQDAGTGRWLNTAAIVAMEVRADDPATFYIWYTGDLTLWVKKGDVSYPTAAAAQTALNTFAAGLG